jgi:hypothetical protein
MSFKDAFIAGISFFLEEKGFTYQQSDPFFSIAENNGRLVKTIALDFSSYGNRHTVLPSLLIRNEDVANVMQAFDGNRFKGKYYFTVRTNQPNLAYLLKKPEYQIGLHVLKDDVTVQAAVKNFHSFMDDIGFSFFDRFKTLADFDKWFNDDVLNGTYDFKVGDSEGSSKEGLVVAKLNNNPRFDELFELWIGELQKEGYGTYIESFKSLKAYLDGDRNTE